MLAPAALTQIEGMMAELGNKGLEAWRKAIRQLNPNSEVRIFFAPDDRQRFAKYSMMIYKALNARDFNKFRRAQLNDAQYPLWIFGSDDRCPCHPWNGLILPSDHPAWTVIFPQNDWHCSGNVKGARSARGALRLGGNPDKPLPAAFNSAEGIAAIAQSLRAPFRTGEGPVLYDLIADLELG